MIFRPPRKAEKSLANQWLSTIPGMSLDAFWGRVEEGLYLPVFLLDRERRPFGVLVLSKIVNDDSVDLAVQLATSPRQASSHAQEIRRLLLSFARRFGCTRITWESKRPGWSNVADKLGATEEVVRKYSLEV